MRIALIGLSVLLCLAALRANASSQQQMAGKGQGTISGKVSDTTGAVLAGAQLVLSNSSGMKLESVSNEKREFSFLGLDAGTYTLTVTVPTFKPYKADNIALIDSATQSLEVTLEPAGTSTEVNVESNELGKVEAETSTLSGTITRQEVVEIGLNGRNFSQLIALAPGVSNQTGQDEGKVGVVGSVKYSVNGGRVEYNTFEVDGSDVLNTGLNGAASTLMVYPSLDAIQEVKVLTSNYGAQYGRTASGTVLVTTKAGGASLHGNIYEFLRNEAFNARNYFDQGKHAPLYRRNDFGGTIGGPLTIPNVYNTKRDKTFFFFSEEFRLEKTPTEYNQAVPSLKERGLIATPQGIQKNLALVGGSTTPVQVFDFTDVCPAINLSGFNRQLYPDCPATANTFSGQGANNLQQFVAPGPNFSYVNDLYSQGGSGIDKNALALLYSNLIPLPNSPTGCNYRIINLDPTDPNHCYDATVSPSTYWREELFRLDHNFTSKVTASFRYIHDSWDTTVLTPQWGAVRNTFPTVQNRFVGPGISMVIHLTDAISPRLLNEFVVSYANSTITLRDQNGPGGAHFQRDPTLGQPLIASPGAPGQCDPNISVDPFSLLPQCAIGYLFNNGFGGKMPGLIFNGTNAAYGGAGFAVDPSYMPWSHTNPTFSFRDTVSRAFGRHTLQLGVQFVYSQRNQTNNAIGAATGDLQGLLSFTNATFSGFGTGNAFADFLLQIPQTAKTPNGVRTYIQNFTQDSAQRRYYQRYQIVEPYIQDDWKVNRRLTLNLGLRISLFGTYSEKNHNAWNWLPSRFNRSAFTVDPVSGALLNAANSTPVLFDPVTALLSPAVISDLGLIQCGENGIPSGCMKGHLFNPAPRIGFAWDPTGSGKTSIRGGYGIFFEHGTGNEANTGSLEANAPLVLNMIQHFPANYSCIGNVGYGSVFDPTNTYCNTANVDNTVPGPMPSAYPLNVTAIPTKAVWPYAQQWSFGIQHELPRNFIVSAAYVGSKGTHLTIERQLNQLRPVSASSNPFGPNQPLTLADCNNSLTPPSVGGDLQNTPFLLGNGAIVSSQDPAYVNLRAACASPVTPDVNALPHPFPGLGKVLSLENVANSSYHALQTTLRRTRGPLTVGVSYSYSHSLDNSSDRSDPVLVDSYNLQANRASSNFDQRHLLNVSYIYQLPNLLQLLANLTPTLEDVDAPPRTPAPPSNSWISRNLLEHWELSGITIFQSGTPFSVINSVGNTGISLVDNAGVDSGLGIAASYPDVVRGLPKPAKNSQSFGPLLGNPSLFVAPRGLTFGNAGRNSLNNPSRLNFDLAVLKHFKIRDSGELEFRAEAFNVFNHTQFRAYDPDNPGSSGNNVMSCYAGPQYSAGFKSATGADCVTGASFLHPINAHRPRTLQLGLKLSF